MRVEPARSCVVLVRVRFPERTTTSSRASLGARRSRTRRRRVAPSPVSPFSSDDSVPLSSSSPSDEEPARVSPLRLRPRPPRRRLRRRAAPSLESSSSPAESCELLSTSDASEPSSLFDFAADLAGVRVRVEILAGATDSASASLEDFFALSAALRVAALVGALVGALAMALAGDFTPVRSGA